MQGFFFLLAAAAVATAQSKEAEPSAKEPLIEQRLIHISEELRCLVCQNESLASSRAELANDLREEVRLIRWQEHTAGVQSQYWIEYDGYSLFDFTYQQAHILAQDVPQFRSEETNAHLHS